MLQRTTQLWRQLSTTSILVAGSLSRSRALSLIQQRARLACQSHAITSLTAVSSSSNSMPLARSLTSASFENKLKRLKLRPTSDASSSSCGSSNNSSQSSDLHNPNISDISATSSSPNDALDLLQLLRQSQDTIPNVIPQELVDSFARRHSYLRISLTEKCNLRCQYCMPEEGVPLTPSANLLSKDEIVRLVRIFAQLGVNKIRFTGGEPLVRKDIEEIMHEVGSISGIESMAITTNGITLPRKLAKLRAAGLKDLNISLDTLQADKFTAITRRLGHERVLESVALALQLGYRPVKVNCVVMRGVNDDEIVDFVEWTRDKAVDVRFIEYMPFDGNQWNDTKLVPYHELLEKIQARYELVREQDGPNATAKTWRVPGFEGTVSFITSMTEHFCSSCNRVRLTADGNFKVCLFGPAEVSLRDAMRAGATDDEIKAIVCGAVGRKKASHAGMYNIAKQKNRPMILIGG